MAVLGTVGSDVKSGVREIAAGPVCRVAWQFLKWEGPTSSLASEKPQPGLSAEWQVGPHNQTGDVDLDQIDKGRVSQIC